MLEDNWGNTWENPHTDLPCHTTGGVFIAPQGKEGCFPVDIQYPIPSLLSQYDLNFIAAKKLDERAVLPKQNKPGDAGYDISALEDIVVPGLLNQVYRALVKAIKNVCRREYNLPKLEATIVRTGISAKIPDGCVGLFKTRSSMAKKLISVEGGVIDSTYTGEWLVCLVNFSFFDYRIKAGDKISQCVIQECKSYPVVEVPELPKTERGEGGFGSTGV